MPFATAAGVGAAVGTSAATVVRFAQSIGYAGFSELRDSLRNGSPPFVTFLQQLHGLADLKHSSSGDLVRLVLRYEQENLAATARSIDPEVVAGAATAIARASRVILVGAGVGRSIVQLLAGHFTRLKQSVITPADNIESVIALANADENDVVVGVSFWRYARSTSESLQLAHERGAVTVAIVDSALYPAIGAVDHALVIRSANAGHGPSTVGAAAAVNMLVSALILTDFDRYFSAIEHLDVAYGEAHLYLE